MPFLELRKLKHRVLKELNQQKTRVRFLIKSTTLTSSLWFLCTPTQMTIITAVKEFLLVKISLY